MSPVRKVITTKTAPAKRKPWLNWLIPAGLTLTVILFALVTIIRQPGATQAAAQPASTPAVPAKIPATIIKSSATEPAPAKTDGSHQPIEAQDGVVSIPVSELVGNTAKFFSYQAAGKVINFFVLRSADGVIRTAFDACDICWEARKGYRQEGDELVCNNCGNRFPSNQVNVVQGGCNPAPLESDAQGETITIQVTDLETGARFF